MQTRRWREMDFELPVPPRDKASVPKFHFGLASLVSTYERPPASGGLLAGRALDISYETEGRWVLNRGSRRSALPR